MYINGYFDLLFKGDFKLTERFELINKLKNKNLKLTFEKNDKFRRKARKKLFNFSIYLYSSYYYIIHNIRFIHVSD